MDFYKKFCIPGLTLSKTIRLSDALFQFTPERRQSAKKAIEFYLNCIEKNVSIEIGPHLMDTTEHRNYILQIFYLWVYNKIFRV